MGTSFICGLLRFPVHFNPHVINLQVLGQRMEEADGLKKDIREEIAGDKRKLRVGGSSHTPYIC